MWKILWFYGIPGKAIKMIKFLYEGQLCAVQTYKGWMQWYTVESSVRQGRLLSPILFIIIIDFVLSSCNFFGSVQLNPQRRLYG